MNHVHRICRSLASLTRRAGMLLACRAAEPAGRPPPSPDRPGGPRNRRCLPRPARSPPQSRASAGGRGPPRERLRARVLPARPLHTIQLCVHCRDRPAGFWVSCTGGQTVRRPWYLSCCQGLDRDRCDVIPFEG